MQTLETQTILVIEDEPEIRFSLTAFLEDLGYRAVTAGDGVSGLAMLRANPPEALLLDLRMPRMDGLEVMRIAAAEFPELPIIVISGRCMFDDVVAALRLHAWDYLQKPIDDMALLSHAIERALERARLIRENRQYREFLEGEVQRGTADLESANRSRSAKQMALTEVLNSIQSEKSAIGRQVVANIQKIVLPQMRDLRMSVGGDQQLMLDQIEAALADVISPFADELSRGLSALTPAELRICSLVKNGLGVKEIAGMECLSPQTISAHRRAIRRKLGLSHKKVNLSSFLRSVGEKSSAHGASVK